MEIKISLLINLSLKRSDVHWLEEELLRLREEVFLKVLQWVIQEVEMMALRRQKECERCGGWLVRNGQECREIQTLGTLRYGRIRLRCQVCGEGIEEGAQEGPVMYIQVDGTGINDRERKDWMECRVGASFSRRVNISKERVWLMDKRTYTSVEEAEAFGEKFYLECLGQGVSRAGKVYFISDGAGWIKKVKADYFPETVGVLDIWHLEREFKIVFGEDQAPTVEGLKSLALQGRVEEIVDILLKETTLDRQRSEKIVQVAEYVMNNAEWIRNISEVGGYGSGPVEKTVDTTVARRFKKRGMNWHLHGVNLLLQLRSLKLNGEWDAY